MASPAQVPFNPNRGRFPLPDSFRPITPDRSVQYDDPTIQIPIQSNITSYPDSRTPRPSAPNHYQPYWQPDPNQAPLPPDNNEQDSRSKKGRIALAVGGVVASLVATGAILAANKSDDKEAPLNPGVTNSQDYETSTEIPPLNMYNRDISYEDYGRQLDVLLPFLEEHGDEIPDSYRESLDSAAVYVGYGRDLSPEYLERLKTAQADIARLNSWLYVASAQPNTVLGKNLVGAIYKPDTQSNKALTSGIDGKEALIGNGQGPIERRNLVVNVSDTFYSGIFNNHKFNTETRIVEVLNSNNLSAPRMQYVLSKYTSQDGKHSGYVIANVCGEDDFDFVDDVQNWKPYEK